jgi:threonine dehydrogenase-like Zn-dependent dehydrogenase
MTHKTLTSCAYQYWHIGTLAYQQIKIMSHPRQIRSLGVEAPHKMYIWSYEEGLLPDGHFRLDTLYTGLSAGTELTFFKATNPYLHSRWDGEYGIFIPNEAGQHYPVPFLGYMEVGRVSESKTPAVQVGDIVAHNYGHKTGHTVHPAYEFFVKLPEGIDPILGIYVAQMGPICANGLLHAAADLYGPNVTELAQGMRGRAVLVTGAGVVGLLTALWAKYLGAAEVAIVDSTPERLEVARAFGVIALNEKELDPARWCKERWFTHPHDRGADVVFQCRGQDAALQMALRCLRPQGAVIDLAFYQDGANAVRLGEEFHHNGLSIQCAQIGRVPRGLANTWNRRRLSNETIEFLKSCGNLIQQHLITDIVPFDEAPQLFEDLSERRRHMLQAVFQVAE